MAAGLLLNLALNEGCAITATTDLCKNVRFRQGDCRECVNICPESAISLELGPDINDNCTGCGLCVSACPTEALQHQVDMEQYLLDAMESLSGDGQAAGEKTSFFIHCREAEKADRNSHPVPCLGNVSENIMLGGALSGVNKIVMSRGACSQCRLMQGEAQLQSSIERFHALQKPLGLEGFELHVEENRKDAEKNKKLSRRTFFSRISDYGRDRSAMSGYANDKASHDLPAGKPDSQNGKRPSPRRETLRKLLKQGLDADTVIDYHTKPVPWATMTVDEEKCIACAICVVVCPTGALVKTFENDQLVRRFNNALCTNCSLCEEACPQQIISFEKACSIADIVEDSATVVARIDMLSCAICGDTIPAREGKICLTCQKRQISPMFLTV
jgi:ferredoxin